MELHWSHLPKELQVSFARAELRQQSAHHIPQMPKLQPLVWTAPVQIVGLTQYDTKEVKESPWFSLSTFSRERFAAAWASPRSKQITCSTGNSCTPSGGSWNRSLPCALGFLQCFSFMVQISGSSACLQIPSESDQEERCKCCIITSQHPRAGLLPGFPLCPLQQKKQQF